MKKLFVLVLTLVMVLGMTTVALADPAPVTYAASDSFTKVINKTYDGTGAAAGLFPAETLEFTVAAAAGNPDGTMITIDDHSVVSNPDTITITVPSYTVAGRYNYTITEVAGNTAGVTYAGTEIGVQVLVTYDNANHKLVAQAAFTILVDDNKVDTIKNTFDVGHLKFDKTVSGNMANQNDEFTVTVTLTSAKPVLSTVEGYTFTGTGPYTASKEYTVKHGTEITVNNIPAGVTYAVTESDPTPYEVTYDDEASGMIVAGETAETSIENSYGAEIETGIALDSVPYILMLAVVGAGLVLFMVKKRRSAED